MRPTTLRSLAVVTTLASVLLGAAPASAETAAPGKDGWVPAPTPSFDYPAGARCDFPIHTEPIVDEVVKKVLVVHPDESPSKIAFKGDLVVRVTNTDTGAHYDADAGGSAIVDIHTDRSQLWHVVGPVLVGVGENNGNLPRGEYRIDGVYTLAISSTGYRTLNMFNGSTDDVCSRIG
ncbi:hypothetical protein ACFU6I_07630 [Streptomyces sp. NPDC057486]|uniref:hypothetical protein n=1 Tax=Streptomyces sp. NPDC057486 TaxID=3346145 RepID=UPI0036AB70EF